MYLYYEIFNLNITLIIDEKNYNTLWLRDITTALSVDKEIKKHLYLISLTLMRFQLDWDEISTMTEPIINDSSGKSKKLSIY